MCGFGVLSSSKPSARERKDDFGGEGISSFSCVFFFFLVFEENIKGDSQKKKGCLIPPGPS